MATLIELAVQLVAARAKLNRISSEEAVAEIGKVHEALKGLDAGTPLPSSQGDRPPLITPKDAFRKNEVVCLVCGKGGFKILSRHLKAAHGMKPNVYRKEFGIPAKTSLSAKSYAEARRKMAKEPGVAGNLARARKVRMEKIEARKVAEAVTPGKRIIVRKEGAVAAKVESFTDDKINPNVKTMAWVTRR